MKRSVSTLGIAMGLGLLPAACGPASQLEGEIDGPGLKAMVGTQGSTGPNGIPKLAWHTWKVRIARALHSPLLLENGAIDPALLATDILADDGGEQVFAHTVSCAVAEGTAVPYDQRKLPYMGRGMVSGVDWAKSGLTDLQITNVLECVVAFVNDKTKGVNILLTGPRVDDKEEEDHTAFIHREALWCASVSGGTVVVDVYPTQSFVDGCGIDAKAALEERYCHEVGTCGLNYRELDKFYDNCVGDEATGQYSCGGKPCTMTWLEDAPAWCELPLTSPPPPPPTPSPLPQ
ncbi:hypothetical protein WME91_53600 [Sorangium sp. So ce269]